MPNVLPTLIVLLLSDNSTCLLAHNNKNSANVKLETCLRNCSDPLFKPANNFCLWVGHLSGQRPVLTGQEASLVGQKYKSV